MGRKRKEVTRTDLMNLWLQKYHHTNCGEVIDNHPDVINSPEWFKLYPCTQEQSDEWVIEAKKLLKKSGIAQRIIDHDWPFIFLNSSPYVPPKEIT